MSVQRKKIKVEDEDPTCVPGMSLCGEKRKRERTANKKSKKRKIKKEPLEDPMLDDLMD